MNHLLTMCLSTNQCLLSAQASTFSSPIGTILIFIASNISNDDRLVLASFLRYFIFVLYLRCTLLELCLLHIRNGMFFWSQSILLSIRNFIRPLK